MLLAPESQDLHFNDFKVGTKVIIPGKSSTGWGLRSTIGMAPSHKIGKVLCDLGQHVIVGFNDPYYKDIEAHAKHILKEAPPKAKESE